MLKTIIYNAKFSYKVSIPCALGESRVLIVSKVIELLVIELHNELHFDVICNL